MEKATLKDITFDKEDTKLLELKTDLLLKAKAIQYSILPKLNTILEDALSRVRKIYGTEVFNEDSIIYASPNFREKRENELKVDYDYATLGITGARKPIWKGFERENHSPVKIIPYTLCFDFTVSGFCVNLRQWFGPKLTDDSFKKFYEFLRKNSHIIHTLQNLSGMMYQPKFTFLSYGEDEEGGIIISLPQLLDQLITLKYWDLFFVKHKSLPIGINDVEDLIDSFVIFYPVYDSILRIAKGEEDNFEELTSKLKLNDLYMFIEDADSGENDGENNESLEPITAEDNENLLAKSVDVKKIVKAGLRWQVMERDDFKCVACGSSPKKGEDVILHVDHIIPRSKGGKDTMDNYQTLCHQCNIGKSNKSQIDLRK